MFHKTTIIRQLLFGDFQTKSQWAVPQINRLSKIIICSTTFATHSTKQDPQHRRLSQCATRARNMCIFLMSCHTITISDGTAALSICMADGLTIFIKNIQTRQSASASTVARHSIGTAQSLFRAIIPRNIRLIITKSLSSKLPLVHIFGQPMFGICLILPQTQEMRAAKTV